MNAKWQAASQDMYKDAQQAEGQTDAKDEGQAGQDQPGGSSGGDDEVTDVDFEEVNDDDKK